MEPRFLKDPPHLVSSNKTSTLCPLEEVISYRNNEVISRFIKEFEVSQEYADQVFLETVKWLWLLANSLEEEADAQLAIYPIIEAIDEMWHTFILYTHDYEQFCHRFFGRFIHHLPATQEEKERHFSRLSTEWDQVKSEMRDKLEGFLSYVGSKLGEETVLKWFGEEETFSKRKLLSLGRKKSADEYLDRYWEDRLSSRINDWKSTGEINFDSKVLEKYLDLNSDARVLIVGYANFADGLACAARNIDVIGLDLSMRGIRTYQKCAESLNLGSHILGIHGDVVEIPLRPLGTFDIILCSMMLHVLSFEQRESVVQKLLKALKKEGKLIVTALSDTDKYIESPEEGVTVEELAGYARANSAQVNELEVSYLVGSHEHKDGDKHEGHHVVQGVFELQ